MVGNVQCNVRFVGGFVAGFEGEAVGGVEFFAVAGLDRCFQVLQRAVFQRFKNVRQFDFLALCASHQASASETVEQCQADAADAQ